MSKLPTAFPSLELTSTEDVSQLRALFTGIRDMFARVANVLNNPDFGATTARPTTQLTVGQSYFDATLGQPIWWDGAQWIDATGAPV